MSKTKFTTKKTSDEHRQVKKRKLEHNSAQEFDVQLPRSARDLRQALTFKQDSPTELRNGIRTFKALLDSILYDAENPDKSPQWNVLKKYCELQSSKDEEDHVILPFPDIIQTWSFGEQSTNESLLSSIPGVLALFLKTVSTEISYREFGVALCKFLLERDQLNLIRKGLEASKTKEHLISPCLRLLTEIVSFDGGAVANALYARRDITFGRLEVLLTLRKDLSGIPEEDRRKPSVRTNAVRYVLANLSFQGPAAKNDLLGQGRIWKAFFDNLRGDPRDLLVDMLLTFEKSLINDSQMSRWSRSKLFNQWNLPRMTSLFGYRHDPELKEDEKPIQEIAASFLRRICTDYNLGVLVSQSGWYPAGSQPDLMDVMDEKETFLNLGLDSPSYVDTYTGSVPVRNMTLSRLAHALRPESDMLQTDLLLSIFESAPELVADYFSRKKSMVSDPKESPAWLGQSAFLFSVVKLGVPKNCGWRDGLPRMPPPASIVIESILPRPLTQKVLTRCLNQNSDIITLYGLRVIKQALHKLNEVLKLYRSALNTDIWTQGASRLKAEFCSRSPTMRDIITVFRNTAADQYLQREAVLETLVLYYQVLPQIAFEEKFDASLPLVDLLQAISSTSAEHESTESLIAQLEHLLHIAERSPTMRWWQKPENLAFSPFTSVLKIFSERKSSAESNRIKDLIETVLAENGVVQDAKASQEAFLKSLRADGIWTPDSAVFAFVDNCIVRLTQKPVLYLDHLEDLARAAGSEKAVSLLIPVILEQWPFVVKADNKDDGENIASWISRYLGYAKLAGEEENILLLVLDRLVATTNKGSKSAFKKAWKKSQLVDPFLPNPSDSNPPNTPTAEKSVPERSRISLEELFGVLPDRAISPKNVTKWLSYDHEEAVQQGYVGDLMMCLCSESEEVRRNAYFNIKSLMSKFEKSTYVEAKQMYLLLGEVAETAKNFHLEALPYIFGELAARSALVLADPLSKMYGKINKYLNKAPAWNVGKIPSYWVDRILLREPDRDDGHVSEVHWLLDLLINGLLSELDMELYRQCNVFERCLAFYAAPGLKQEIRRKILHLVYRASEVGGSTTLITRTGIISWIQAQATRKDGNDVILRELGRRLYDSSDQKRGDGWGGVVLSKAVEQLRLE